MKEKKTAIDVLKQVFGEDSNSSTKEDLQMAITLNPHLNLIEQAMSDYAAQFEQKWNRCSNKLPINGELYNIIYNGVVQHCAYRFIMDEDVPHFECCMDESLTLNAVEVSEYMPLPTPTTTKK